MAETGGSHDPGVATLSGLADEIAGPGEHAAEDAVPQPFRAYNVVAVFAHGEAATRALAAAAERFPADALSYVALHREGETCACRLEGGPVDAPGLGTRLAAKGAALGAAAGAALGAAGVVALPGIGTIIGAGLLSAVIGGAGMGGATGGAVGAYAHLRESEAGRSTRADVAEGRAVVAVHVDTQAAARRARTLLERHDPEATRVFDARGHALGR